MDLKISPIHCSSPDVWTGVVAMSARWWGSGEIVAIDDGVDIGDSWKPITSFGGSNYPLKYDFSCWENRTSRFFTIFRCKA